MTWYRTVVGSCCVTLAGAAVLSACGQGKPASPPQPPTAIVFRDVTRQAGFAFRHIHGGSGRKYMPETMGSGVAFLDYDGDGWLDVFLVNGAPLPGYSDPQPLYPALYRNKGDGTFEEVTAQAGLRFASVRFSNDELKALGSPFKQVLDELKRWGSAAKDPGLRDVLVERRPELSDSPEAAALLAQKVQALRVRTGRQKGWTKPG